jgi:hypothetical protein
MYIVWEEDVGPTVAFPVPDIVLGSIIADTAVVGTNTFLTATLEAAVNVLYEAVLVADVSV